MIIQIFIFLSVFKYDVTSLQASDFYVDDLPLLSKSASASVRMHAGYLPVNSADNSTVFFWHFSEKITTDKPRTVIWLNGGPGQSSLIGTWTEIGPFRFLDETTIVENNGSWHLHANLLFIDQPIGTGFSYADKNHFVKELDEMTEYFLSFLDRYVEIFPEFLQQDIYLAGESFAGQYIPYIAQAILKKRSLFKLRGLLIGNGWIDPVSIYNSYLPFAIANNLVKNDSSLHPNMTDMVNLCQEKLSEQEHIFEPICYSILLQIVYNNTRNEDFIRNENSSCVNMYDIRLNATQPDCGMNGPSELKYVSAYLNRPDVMSRIHINGKKSEWKDFDISVYFAFSGRNSTPSSYLLPDLLRQIPIILYNGEYDLICNYWATENMLNNMTWNDRIGFDLGNGTMAPIYSWFVDGESAGYIRYARNLTYILFYNAGHMVPYDQASRSRAMLHQFIQLDFNTNSSTYPVINQSIYYNFQKIRLLGFAMIITVIVFMGFIWFFVHRQQKSKTITFDQNHMVQQQSVLYSRLNDSDESFMVLNNTTSV